MNFYAFKSVFYDYLIFGKRATPIKFIAITEDIKVLPRFRFEYTPYGPGWYIQAYFKGEELSLRFPLAMEMERFILPGESAGTPGM